jgi:hypothetical protein
MIPPLPWQFGYAPVTPAAGAPEDARDLVLATTGPIPPERAAALAGPGFSAATLIARAPLFWTRLLAPESASPAALADGIRVAGVDVRYVASAERPSLAIASAIPLQITREERARPEPSQALREAPLDWRPARSSRRSALPTTPGTWFLRDVEGGVAVDRTLGRRGRGTRLAVIDDDAMNVDHLELDAEVLVGLDQAPRHGMHGPLMAAWAVGSRGFEGVAPQASVRLYLMPKPGRGLVGLPLALARAVFDGADVIVCATYVDGSTSPMLDDALEVAALLGRRGRGAAVVLPTGRETSSAPGSLHASFSLGFGEPASDSRVFCVGPGGRGGGWFLWRDRQGRLRPFGNRGPAVRWLAPGDDLAYPFAIPHRDAPEPQPERLYHAESSGAAAVAAGVLLLVLAANPTLRRAELASIVDATLVPIPPTPREPSAPLADRADLLPHGRDADGHNAKHGLGLLCARRACLAAADPVCGALIAMGEDDAARFFADLRRTDPVVSAAYSCALARWVVRALLADREAALALRAILRHLRLVAGNTPRLTAHGTGALLRSVALLLRRLLASTVGAPAAVRAELAELARRVIAYLDEPASLAFVEEGIAGAFVPCLGPLEPS